MRKHLLKHLLALVLFLAPQLSFSQTITLGTASQFSLFTTSGAITNSGTGYLTRLTGKVGSNSGSSTGFGNVDGTMHSGDAVTISAAANLLTAYNQLNSATPTFFPSSSLGNGVTMVPGVYSISGPATLAGNLTLDAQGNPGAVFIFQIGGALSSAANSKVKIINGGLACNVYWKVEGLVSLASGTTMRGTIVANNAAISLGTLDTLEGRALSINGAITLNSLTAATPIGCGSPTLTGPTAPTLGAVAAYAIFSSNGPVSNGTGITNVTGDVGTNLGLTTGYNPLNVNGTIHPIPDGSTAAAAPALSTARNQLNALPVDITLLYPATFGNSLVLTPHTYALNAATSLTDTLFLNAQGNAAAVFVIRVNGAFSAISGATVKLINGTQSKNVYWQVEGAVSLGSNTVFHGNIIANNGAIDLLSGANLTGRALSTTGAITTNGNTINAPLGPSSTITGDSVVCAGSSIPLTGYEPGGVWSVTNPRASITSSGVLTGITAGLDTVKYIVTNGFGTATASRTITIQPAPSSLGAIGGPSIVCVGSSITLTNTTAGGTWSSNNANASVVNGVVTGLNAGSATITYSVTNACGNSSVNKIITVNTPPTVNAVSNQVVCGGSPTAAVTFTGTATSFSWTNDNTTIGLAGTGSGNIPSFTALNTTTASTIATITVTPSNGCAGTSTSFTLTVKPTPNTVTVANQTVCNGASTTAVVNSGTVPGTSFTWTNNNTSIGLTGSGTGNIPSFNTINSTSAPLIANITVTPNANSCTGVSKSFLITVNPTPDVVAIPSQTVCNGAPTATITYAGAVSGTIYSWTNNNVSIGLGASGNGNILSFTALNNTSVLTTANINVTPSANGCTGAAKQFAINVNPTPNTVTVANQAVCNGAPTTAVINSGTVPGTSFTWTNNNTIIGLTGSGTGNIPSFNALNSTSAPLIANITVTPNANSCTGVSKSFLITVNPTPDVVAIPSQTVCNGAPTATITYAGAVSGTIYSWTNNNVSIGLGASGNGNILSFTALNNTSVLTTANINVTPSANGCTGAAKQFAINVNPTPTTGAVANQTLCNGLQTTAVAFTGNIAGTSFAWTNDNVTIGLASAGSGNIPAFTASSTASAPAVAHIAVTPTANGCTGLTTMFTITVNSTPTAPVIALTSPASVCHMTYFRNFGAATLPPAGMNYTWSTINASVSDTGNTQQYALINFKKTGTATVILTSTNRTSGCLNTARYNVEVSGNVADTPAQVIYFNKSFVCLQNNEEAYAWGYDDARTLAPTMLKGEMNQDYVNASPNLDSNKYWVMVTHNGCIQKTYYNKPPRASTAKMVAGMTVFPNPAAQQIQVAVDLTAAGDIRLDIYSSVGQKMFTTNNFTNNTKVDVSDFAPGVYMIICYQNGEKITTRFTKN